MNNWFDELIKKLPGYFLPFIAVLLAFAFNPPLELQQIENGLWSVQIEQSRHLSDNNFLEDVYYGYNRAMRLFQPLLFKLFQIERPVLAYLLQIVFSVIQMFLVYAIAKRILKEEKKNILLFLISCSTLYFANSAFGDTFGHCDTFGFTFMLLAMYYPRKWLLSALFLLLGFLCSERVLFVGLISVIIYWYYCTDLSVVKKKKLIVFSTLVSVLCYFGLKFYMTSLPDFDVSLPIDIGLNYALNDHTFFQIYFFTFTGFWILLMATTSMSRNQLLVLTLPLLLSGTSFLVADQTRGMAHIFPVFFVFLYQIQKTWSADTIHKTLNMMLLICLISPSYNYIGTFNYKPSLFYYFFEHGVLKNMELVFNMINS
ncbi:MAG: hypothetical protein ACI9DJ_002650 [Algoriphagus sp.]|jgi:hypothetical protein